MMTPPEVHNIIARWVKEPGSKSNIGLKLVSIESVDPATGIRFRGLKIL